MTVSPRPNKHPLLRAHYVNGRERAVCVRNLEPKEILAKAELLRSASGAPVRHTTRKVFSENESVRGIWDPYHGHEYQV